MIFQITRVAFVLSLFAALLLSPSLRAGEQELSTTTETSAAVEDPGTGNFQSFPFKITATIRGGYDDNVYSTTTDEEESFFSNVSLGLEYDFGSPRTKLSLRSGAGFTYYWDAGESGFGSDDEYDVNAFLGFNLTHRASARLTLSASVYLTYQSAPDFAALTTGLGIATRSRDFFYTVDKFTAAYMWTPRFSTATSYTFGGIWYDDRVISSFEDRYEHTIGNEFRYLIWPTTTVVAEYRYGMVDYHDGDSRDSMSHYALAGFDHSFNPRFNASLRAGVEFRRYDMNDPTDGYTGGGRTHPYAEATLTYALGQNTSLSWLNRYALEQPDFAEALGRTTYRTGLSVRHNWTARISTALGAFYQHDTNDQTLFGVSDFEEDAIDLTLSARYAFNRNFAIEGGYHHTDIWSDVLFREYTRNRYWLGAVATF